MSRLGFDALGAPIEGQVGNRTPTTAFVYPRRPARQGVPIVFGAWSDVKLIYATWADVQAANPLWQDLVVPQFPDIPDTSHHRPTPIAAVSAIPYRIGRYYQLFDVSVVPPELVARYRTIPVVQVPSSVPNRIGRYYQVFDVSTVAPPAGDATVDRARPQPPLAPTSSIPYRIQRYYQAFDVSTVAPTPDNPIDRARSQANPTTQSAVPYRIKRYYAPFVDVTNTTDPIDRSARLPYVLPASSVANRIRRYYSPQIIDVVGDQPADRAQPRVQVRADPFRYASMVRRYYRYAPDGDVVIVAVPPGSMTVTFSGATTTTRFQSTANTSVTLATA